MKFKYLIFFLIVLSIPSFAWHGETHEKIASDICKLNIDCMENNCLPYIIHSTDPDRVFKDVVNHHVYYECVPAPTAWWCDLEYKEKCFDCTEGELTDSVAFDKTLKWIESSKTKSGCDKWIDIFIASHYYSDTYVLFHKTKGEKASIHSGYEKKVNDAIKLGGPFQVCYKDMDCVSDIDIKKISYDFTNKFLSEESDNPIQYSQENKIDYEEDIITKIINFIKQLIGGLFK